MSTATNTNPTPQKSPFKKAWDAWMKFNHMLGNVIAKFWLTLLYFTVLVPFGIWTRLSVDPLDLRPKPAATYWRPHTSSSSPSITEGRE